MISVHGELGVSSTPPSRRLRLGWTVERVERHPPVRHVVLPEKPAPRDLAHPSGSGIAVVGIEHHATTTRFDGEQVGDDVREQAQPDALADKCRCRRSRRAVRDRTGRRHSRARSNPLPPCTARGSHPATPSRLAISGNEYVPPSCACRCRRPAVDRPVVFPCLAPGAAGSSTRRPSRHPTRSPPAARTAGRRLEPGAPAPLPPRRAGRSAHGQEQARSSRGA